jgi:hypothetical protein
MNKGTLICVVTSLIVAAALGQVPGDERYNGFDIPLLAEATARLNALRSQHGEKAADGEFATWLESKGVSRTAYEQAFAAWWERFRADPTGQLQARFHRIDAEWSQRLNFADAKDHRQDTREGVTLDTYARLVVELTRAPGAKLEDVVKRHGLSDVAHWQRVNEAWSKAMGEDTTFTLTQQYGALYQKYAGAQFAAEQDAVTANAVAARPSATPATTTQEEPLTIEAMVARAKASQGLERWEAARMWAHECVLWSAPGKPDRNDPRARHCGRAVLDRELAPAIEDALDHADDDSVAFAAGLAEFLPELGLATKERRLTVERATNRIKERLAVLESAFEPIEEKAVPERLPLRAKIDANAAALRDLRVLLESW